METQTSSLLQVQELHAVFHTPRGDVQAVRGVSFRMGAGESLGIIGESGCGKSATAMSVCGLLPKNGTITQGSVQFQGTELTRLPARAMRTLRGKRISVIFQDSLTSLDPLVPVGRQIAEVIRVHEACSRQEANRRARDMLGQVGFPAPERQMRSYPHELSGGMRQRVMIAMALCCQPELLIADEPTTALDVTTQAQILNLMKQLQTKLGTAVLMITHDLGVMAGYCRSLLVMYGGLVMEAGPTSALLNRPRHPYTAGLLSIVSDLNGGDGGMLASIEGAPPQLLSPPPGCPFAPRCKYAMGICQRALPPFFDGESGRVRCWLWDPACPPQRRDCL